MDDPVRCLKVSGLYAGSVNVHSLETKYNSMLTWVDLGFSQRAAGKGLNKWY